LSNNFIDIIDYIRKDNPHAPVIGTTIPGLIFADDLAFSSFTINGLQKAMDQITKYRRERNLNCNLNKAEILVFKNGGNLKEDEIWTVNDQKIEVADEKNYLGVTFESSGGWKRKKLKTIVKANQTLVAINKCLPRTPDIRVKIFRKCI
jgi:hypothetical protein